MPRTNEDLQYSDLMMESPTDNQTENLMKSAYTRCEQCVDSQREQSPRNRIGLCLMLLADGLDSLFFCLTTFIFFLNSVCLSVMYFWFLRCVYCLQFLAIVVLLLISALSNANVFKRRSITVSSKLKTRSVAVANKADGTAYEVRYSAAAGQTAESAAFGMATVT